MEEVDAVLPVTPWVLAAVATVLVAALSLPPGGPRPAPLRSGPGLLAGRLGATLAALAALAVVVVARLGAARELRNPVPALVLGLGWPLLLLVPALVGLVRGPGRTEVAEPAAVWPAVPAALGVVGFLTLPTAPTRPAAVATAVTAYALVVLAACVAVGRVTVAARFEVLGLLARWCGLGRGLTRWHAPAGASAVLAVLLGGAWFERYERSLAWSSDLPGRGDAALGLGVALLVAAGASAALHRATRGGSPGTAAAALLPLVVGTVVAGVSRRALISAQLLADQAAGPRSVDADPLGLAGGQLLALGLVTLGGALASAVLARRMGEGAARLPGVGLLLLLTGMSAWVVLQP